jgi:peptide/nickel transport system ATP-binding protein
MTASQPQGQPLLTVSGLDIAFRRGAKRLPAVNQLGFEIAAGETLALLGESGCGKSISALALMRLLPPNGVIEAGSVQLQTGDAPPIDLLRLPESAMRQQRGQAMAMIFQEPATSLNPVLTVWQQLDEVLIRQTATTASTTTTRQQQALALLQQVGIADPEKRLAAYPFQLSGGMKQRVMIAMALAAQPRLLIADEPTTALDVTVQAQILDLLADLQQTTRMGMLLITHDLGVVARMAHRIGVMYAGELVEMAPRTAFFTAPRHPYTQALFAALPEAGKAGATLTTLAGQVPPLSAMPDGCCFAPRCPHALPLCQQQSPVWQTLPDNPAHQIRCHRVHELSSTTPATASLTKPAEAIPAAQNATPAEAPDLLRVEDLQVHFPIRRGLLQRTVGHVKAVDGVTLHLKAGRTLALVGESGCGKTTVGKAILQLQAATGGQITLAGKALRTANKAQDRKTLHTLRHKMQMVFQDPFASLNPRLRIGEIISEGMEAMGLLPSGKANTSQRQALLEQLLQQVGLPADALQRYPHEFSGGQRQRIAIARALAVQPALMICDEPTSALDVSVQAQILNLLKTLQAELGMAYLFITHNFAVVDYLADDIAVMYLGRIVEQGEARQILEAPQHPYTRALLSAVPQARLPDARDPAVIRLPGETPSPSNPPSGCHFHPRCREALPVCRTQYPAVQTVAGRQVCCHLYTPQAT